MLYFIKFSFQSRIDKLEGSFFLDWHPMRTIVHNPENQAQPRPSANGEQAIRAIVEFVLSRQKGPADDWSWRCAWSDRPCWTILSNLAPAVWVRTATSRNMKCCVSRDWKGANAERSTRAGIARDGIRNRVYWTWIRHHRPWKDYAWFSATRLALSI